MRQHGGSMGFLLVDMSTNLQQYSDYFCIIFVAVVVLEPYWTKKKPKAWSFFFTTDFTLGTDFAIFTQ
jgi:hypothetical protein